MYDIYTVNYANALSARTGTDGFQPKFLYDNDTKFIKSQCELNGYLRDDWMVEYIASQICLFYNINSVVQTPCRLNIVRNNKIFERMGVISDNFELEGLQFISCFRLFELNDTSVNTKYYRSLSSIDKIYFLIEKLSLYANLNYYDVANYIFGMFFVDLLVLNQDRHFHNFGVMWDTNINAYVVPKLFDFGMGLFENSNDYDDCYSLDDALYYANIEPLSEEPVVLANLLLQNNDFLNYLDNKRSYGELILDRSLFPSYLAYEYFLGMKNLLNV